MSDQPEALRLADVLDAHQFDEPHAAAACLRRQHAEIEALKAERDAPLEALKFVIRGVPDTWEGVQKARAAIKQAEEKK